MNDVVDPNYVDKNECDTECFIDVVKSTMDNLSPKAPEHCTLICPVTIDEFLRYFNKELEQLISSFPKHEVSIISETNSCKITFKEHTIYVSLSGFNLRVTDMSFVIPNFYISEETEKCHTDYLITPYNIGDTVEAIVLYLVNNPYGLTDNYHNKGIYSIIKADRIEFRDLEDQRIRPREIRNTYKNVKWQYPVLAQYIRDENRREIEEYPYKYYEIKDKDVILSPYFFVIRIESDIDFTTFIPCKDSSFETMSELTTKYLESGMASKSGNLIFSNSEVIGTKTRNFHFFIINAKGEIQTNYMLKF